MFDTSPCRPHGDDSLIGLPFFVASEDKFSEDDRFEDLFATKDDFHGYKDVLFPHDDHDMDVDDWKFVREPIYDSSNEGRVKFEHLGRPTFDEDPYELVQPHLFTIDDDIGLHMDISIAGLEQQGLSFVRGNLN